MNEGKGKFFLWEFKDIEKKFKIWWVIWKVSGIKIYILY